MRNLIGRAWRRATRRPRPAILMYHRIAESRLDPWNLSVPPGIFRDQLDALKSRRRVLSVDELVGRLKSGDLPSDAVAITFDDGYADNFLAARPSLEEAGLPATMFLTTGCIGSDAGFWWDELAHMVLGCLVPIRQTVRIGRDEIAIDLPPFESDAPSRPKWRADQPPRSAREQAYLTLWKRLQGQSPEDREHAIAALQRIFPPTRPAPEDRPMSAVQVRALVSDFITIGGHSRRHHPLPALPLEERRREIEESRSDCKALTGRDPTGFAYPHGERDGETMDLVRRAGYSWACSTRWAAIDRMRFDPFDLPRIGVHGWSGRDLLRKLELLST